ncbi:hypothetical protein VTH82DRAFT_2821 [Thermothelomyces myriococcoides]
MFARGNAKERTSPRKVTPPSPSYMTSEQFAAYLADLRSNRIARPAGARPPPASKRDTSGLTTSGDRSSVAAPSSSVSSLHQISSHQRARSDAGSVPPTASRPSVAPSISSQFPLARGKDGHPDQPVQPLKSSEVVPSATYIERGQRWMEKEEASSLRRAMEAMDLKDQSRRDKEGKEGKEGNDDSDEERRIYNAALEEAAELVWQHQNPGKLPEPGAPYRYRPHLRKNSYAHARAASLGSPEPGSGRASFTSSRQPPDAEPGSNAGQDTAAPAGSVKSQGDISSNGARPGIGRFARSRQMGGIGGDGGKPFSGDQIWEEPDNETSEPSRGPSSDDLANPLRPKPKDPLNRLRFPRRGADGLKTTSSPPSSPEKVASKYETRRNSPTQSLNPQYTVNAPPPTQVAQREDVPRKHGMEIRSEDIVQATSMKLKDRSPKLPTPSAVSDSPGRPIVSFDKNWKPHEEATDGKSEKSTSGRGSPNRSECFNPGGIRQQQSQRQEQTIPAISVTGSGAASSATRSTSPTRRPQPPPPSIQVEGPPVPTIAVSDPSSPSPPAIVVEPEGASSGGPDIPVIVTPDDGPADTAGSSRRPLPTPQSGAPRIRQAARPRASRPPASRPAGSRATARCHECGGAIEGRFVSLAGMSERFHPECFTCYACGTSLEALEISPEPDDHRAARLDRIARRAAGEILPEEPGQTMQGMTHIEKDGYAWCVSCQTKRTERRAPKCRKCRKAVIGQYIRALGGEWHDECFRCATCNGGFDDGQIFPLEGRGAPGETVVLCTKCMEKELKA